MQRNWRAPPAQYPGKLARMVPILRGWSAPASQSPIINAVSHAVRRYHRPSVLSAFLPAPPVSSRRARIMMIDLTEGALKVTRKWARESPATRLASYPPPQPSCRIRACPSRRPDHPGHEGLHPRIGLWIVRLRRPIGARQLPQLPARGGDDRGHL
jgi:hypothetical protein